MSRNFNGSSDSILISNAQINATPWTFAVWVNTTTATANNGITSFCIDNSANNNDSINIGGVNTSGQVFASVSDNSAAFTTIAVGSSLVVNTWYPMVFTSSATNNRNLYVNNSGTVTNNNATVTTGGSANQTEFGKHRGGSFFPGLVAHGAIWNIVLTNTEIDAFCKGALPYTIRNSSLVGWWPLDGIQSTEPDLSGKTNNGTLTGTALAFGPPAMMLTPRSPLIITAAAAASFQAAWAMRNRIVVEGIGI